jgi:hypothetical protein
MKIQNQAYNSWIFTEEKKREYKESHSTSPGFTSGEFKINSILSEKSQRTPDVSSGQVLRFQCFG